MGKIFDGIEGIEKRVIRGNWKEHQKAEEEYAQAIRDYCKKNGSGEFAGEEIRFQVADGYACYVVLSLKPVQLVHLDIVDGYQEQYVHRLTAGDIKQKIEQARAWSAIFEKHA